jgi:hypothetical protein
MRDAVESVGDEHLSAHAVEGASAADDRQPVVLAPVEAAALRLHLAVGEEEDDVAVRLRVGEAAATAPLVADDIVSVPMSHEPVRERDDGVVGKRRPAVRYR